MLTKLLDELNIIQQLSDRPNEEDGLSSEELKERFDMAGNLIKTYLNNVLSNEVDTLDAQNVKLTGTQTVAGIKTFSSSPIVPAPTQTMQASTKKYVDDTMNTHKVSGDHDTRYYSKDAFAHIIENFQDSIAGIGTGFDEVINYISNGTLPPGASDLIYVQDGTLATASSGIVYI